MADGKSKCCFMKVGGERCKNWPIKGKKFCYWHRTNRFTLSTAWNIIINNRTLAFCGFVLAVAGLILEIFPSWPRQIEERFTTPPYSVRVDTCLMSDRWILGPFFATFANDQKIAPVQSMLHIVMTNNQRHPVLVSGFGVKMKTENGDWAPLDRVQMIGLHLYFPLNGDLSKSGQFTAESMDAQLSKHPLQPNETVQGWAAFSYPKEYGPVFLPEFKVFIDSVSSPSPFESNIVACRPDSVRKPIVGSQLDTIKLIYPTTDLSKKTIGEMPH